MIGILGAAGLLALLEQPLEELRACMGIVAGRKTPKVLGVLPLYLTEEQFAAVAEHPVIKQAYLEARLHEKAGELSRCPTCKGLCNPDKGEVP